MLSKHSSPERCRLILDTHTSALEIDAVLKRLLGLPIEQDLPHRRSAPLRGMAVVKEVAECAMSHELEWVKYKPSYVLDGVGAHLTTGEYAGLRLKDTDELGQLLEYIHMSASGLVLSIREYVRANPWGVYLLDWDRHSLAVTYTGDYRVFEWERMQRERTS